MNASHHSKLWQEGEVLCLKGVCVVWSLLREVVMGLLLETMAMRM